MKAILSAGGCALLALLLLVPARAQDVIWIIQSVDDEPLEKVVSQLAMMGGVQVTVGKTLRAKKISLEIDAELSDALDLVAKAAGGRLVKTGPKSYEIRVEPADGADAGEETATEDALPEWARPLAEKLSKTEVTYLWQGEPLPKILDCLSRETGVKMRLDPRVLKERSKDALGIHVCTMDESMKPLPITTSAELALAGACTYPGVDLEWVWRFGGIWVSTREHVEALAPDVLPPAGAAPEGPAAELRKSVEAAKVTLKLDGAKLDKAVEAIAKKGGVKIVFDRALAKEFAEERVDLDATDAPLPDVLGLVLLPRGLTLESGEKSLTVRRVKKP